MVRLIKVTLAVGVITLVYGCSTTPSHLDSRGQDDRMKFARQVVNEAGHLVEAPHHLSPVQELSQAQIIGPGDLLNIRVMGLEEFNGLYQVNQQGRVELPYMDALFVAGLTRQALMQLLTTVLIKNDWLYVDAAMVNVSVVRLSSATIAVSGSVFSAGQVTINAPPKNKAEDTIQQQSGVFANGRSVIAALMAAGGIRPDADLSAVYLMRHDKTYRIDLTGLLAGDHVVVPSLATGDRLYVASSGLENEDYIRPSQITPPGMRVFMSNSTAPTLSNAQSNIGNDSNRLPYGTTLIEAAISANCVGGTQTANASRSVILITRNYGGKQQVVIKRSISQLLQAASNKQVNPYLMPNDALACYDSRFTNFRDVARGLGELINPFILGRLL